jgi:hypothetical protein
MYNLYEKEFTSTKPSRSSYFDTKHYTFSLDNVVRWATANHKIIEVSLEDFLCFWKYDEVPHKIFETFGYFVKQGIEAIVLKKTEDNKVYKIIFDNGMNKDPWEIAKDKLVRHNRIFPETSYKLSHVLHIPWKNEKDKISRPDLYYEIKNIEWYNKLPVKDYWPVLCQDILDRKNINSKTLDAINYDTGEYTETPIDKYLKNKGFKQLNKHPFSGSRIYKKRRTFISDIHDGNIGRDKEGNYRVFDAILSTNPKDFEGVINEFSN